MRHRSPLAIALALLWTLAAGAATADQTSASAPSAPAKVNVNTASAAELSYLPRLGSKVAERIVEYRKANGPFGRPEQLMEVKGIGEKLFLVLKPYLAVSGPTTLRSKVRTGSSPKSRSDRPAQRSASPSTRAVPVGKGR
jgi:competence protein ComEA